MPSPSKTSSLVFLHYLTTVFDNLSDAILLIGVEKNGYRLLMANAAFFASSGHQAEDIGRKINEIVTKESYASLAKDYQKAVRSKKTVEYTRWYEVPRGHRAYAVKLIPILNTVGECVQITAITRDVTDQLRLQDEVERLRAVIQTIELTARSADTPRKR